MNSDENKKTTKLAARLKMAVAGLALAGALAGGAVAIADVDPVGGEETTETALRVKVRFSTQAGLSWQ